MRGDALQRRLPQQLPSAVLPQFGGCQRGRPGPNAADHFQAHLPQSLDLLSQLCHFLGLKQVRFSGESFGLKVFRDNSRLLFEVGEARGYHARRAMRKASLNGHQMTAREGGDPLVASGPHLSSAAASKVTALSLPLPRNDPRTRQLHYAVSALILPTPCLSF